MQFSNRISADQTIKPMTDYQQRPLATLSQMLRCLLLQKGAVHLLLLWLSALVLGLTLQVVFTPSIYAHTLESDHPAVSTFALASSQLAVPGNVIFVDASAAGPTHDGTSWATAYTTLQDALAAATAGTEIWVATGVYYPDEGGSAVANSVTATFALQNDVAIYGGFAGNEGARSERDWLVNRTVLSGDLTQNDPDTDGNGIITNPETIVGSNALHVVTASGVDATAILDGFVVTAGTAVGISGCDDTCKGGGLFIENSTLLLQNLAVYSNIASQYGGGFYLASSDVTLQNVAIQGNRASIEGGGIYASGGALAATNVLFSGNRSYNNGGALFTIGAATPITFTNLTISGNRTQNNGAAIANRGSHILLYNSIIWDNASNGNTPIYIRNNGTLMAVHSVLDDSFTNGSWNNTQGTDGGNNIDLADPLFVTALSPFVAPTLTGDLRLQSLSPAADAGANTFNTTATDLDGVDRTQGAAIDLGVYESAYVAQLAITQTVEPATIEYGESITYTVVLSNSGDAFAYQTVLTDLLPSNVDFTAWVQQPTGAVYTTTVTPRIAWQGAVAADDVITFQFVATHTGAADEAIDNTTSYSHPTSSDSDDTTVVVLPLPTVDVADVTVDESAGSATFTVTLSATSRKAVAIPYATSDGLATTAGADYTSLTGTLTIPVGSDTGTVTVAVNSDFIDEETETFNLTLLSPTDGQLGDATAVATILDDDTAGSAVSPTVLDIDEPAETSLFTITLNSQPVAPVLVTLNNSDTSECSLPATVTINENNWQNGVGVTVQAVDDFVVDNIQTCMIALSTGSSDPHYDSLSLTPVQVNVHSDDTAGISVAPSAPFIGEANLTGFFTITLTSEPTATVNIALAAGDPTECSVISSVALDAGNWRTGVPVPVTTLDDDVDDDDQLCAITSVVTSIDGNYDGRSMVTVPVTVVDDDTAGVAVGPTALTTNEPSGTTSFNLSLTSRPVAPVTVQLTSQDTSECSVQQSITLDETTWNVDALIPVMAVDDRIDDADQLCVIETTVVSNDAKYNAIAADDIDVTVQDDGDSAGVLLSAATATVAEPATTAGITVTLNSEPVAPVTIQMASEDESECGVTTSVTLDASNWERGQAMLIHAIDDHVIDDAQSCTVTTTAVSADANYSGIAVADPVVTVNDNDYADVVMASANVIVREPNNNALMILKLTSIPTAPVNVALSSTDPGECSVPNNVTLDGLNWESGVGAPVFAVNDDVDDGDQTCNISATITSADSHYDGITVADFPATVVDDDTAGTTVSATTVAVSEPANSANFTVALTSEPTAPVTVTLVSGDSGECSVPATTTLDAGNWRTGAIVTVNALDDDLDDESQACVIQTSTSSNDPKYQAIAIDDVTAIVADDEVASVVVSPAALTIGEPAITDTFTIRLTSEPTKTVTVTLISNDLGECMVPTAVQLDAGNWAQGIAVPVQATDDRIDDADQLCTVGTAATSADGDYDNIAVADVAVTVQDDGDTAGIAVSAPTLTVSEPTEQAYFTITLDSEPVDVVTINLRATDGSECSVPPAVTLDSTNWEQGVPVAVAAVDDDVDDGTQSCVIETNATSNDPLYQAKAVADVAVTVLDEDIAGFALSTTAFNITEPSAVFSYTFALTSEPTAPVNVTLQSSDSGECSVTPNITLDGSNWRGITVPVSAVNDDVMDGPQPCLIQSSVNSADPLYNGGTVDPLTVTVLDEDVAGIVVSPQQLAVDELNGTALFTVALTSEPTAAVSIDLASLDTTECSVPANVTLTAQNWRGVALAVTAVDDFQADDDQICLVESSNATSADANYDAMTVADVIATVVDDEEIAVLFAPAEPVVREPNATTTVQVRLGSLPTAPVTLLFTSSAADECTVTANATLTTANWRDGVDLTVTAVDDSVDDGAQTCTINTVASSGDGNYNGLAVAGLPVTVEDDEVVAMTATVQASHGVAEIGTTVTYTYQVINTGDVPLTVAALDSGAGKVTFEPRTIAPQATAQGRLTRTVRESDLPGPLVHDVAFTAQTAANSIITATQTSTVAVAANPQLAVNVIRLGPPFVSPQTVVTYQVTITNTGQVPAEITAIRGEAAPPTRSVEADALQAEMPTVVGTALQALCQTPLTVAPGAAHQCTLTWTAVKGESDAMEFTVNVEAKGLMDFTATSSGSDVVIISGPTSAGSLRIYLPVVSR